VTRALLFKAVDFHLSELGSVPAVIHMCVIGKYDLDPIQGKGHRASEVPKIALFNVYLLHCFCVELNIASGREGLQT